MVGVFFWGGSTQRGDHSRVWQSRVEVSGWWEVHMLFCLITKGKKKMKNKNKIQAEDKHLTTTCTSCANMYKQSSSGSYMYMYRSLNCLVTVEETVSSQGFTDFSYPHQLGWFHHHKSCSHLQNVKLCINCTLNFLILQEDFVIVTINLTASGLNNSGQLRYFIVNRITKRPVPEIQMASNGY